MVLNEKGVKAYQKWEDIYYTELNRLREELHDSEYFEGWCIIDDKRFLHDFKDEIEMMVFGYDVEIAHVVKDWERFYETLSFRDGREYPVSLVRKCLQMYYDGWDE